LSMQRDHMRNWKSPRTTGSGHFLTSNDKTPNMPKEKSYKWKLGLVAVAALIIAVAAIYYVGKKKNKFGAVLHIPSQFSSVSGLKVGSNVRLGGIDVGTVDQIQLTTDTTVQV